MKIYRNFKRILGNFLYPKKKKELIIEFVGVSGVGKTHLTKKTFAKFSNKFMSKGFARGFFKTLKLTYPKHIQQIEDVFCKYPEFNPPHWHLKKYLTGELCARCLSRNFYIDEAVINTAPLYILQDIDKNHPEILKRFFKNTIVVWETDTAHNIAIKRTLRQKQQHKHLSNWNTDEVAINDNIKIMNERIKLLQKYNVPILTLNANNPIGENVKQVKTFIKKYQ